MKPLVLALAAAGLITTGALATSYVAGPAGPSLLAAAEAHGWRGGGHGWRGGFRGGPVMDEARVEAALAFARTRLGITEAQEPQWQALAEVVRAEAARLRPVIEAMRDMHHAEDAPSAPERLERLETMAAAGAEAIAAMRASFTELYAVLDDEQKQRADELLRRGPHGRR